MTRFKNVPFPAAGSKIDYMRAIGVEVTIAIGFANYLHTNPQSLCVIWLKKAPV